MTTPDTVDTSRDSEDTVRVYNSSRRSAHTVWAPLTQGSICIYCGARSANWLGVATEKQKQKALSLPYCEDRTR